MDALRPGGGRAWGVPDPLVEVQGLTKVFGPTLALDAVDLRVDPGAVVALLGPNGAGKTTLLKLLATAIKPNAGGGGCSVRICSRAATGSADASA